VTTTRPRPVNELFGPYGYSKMFILICALLFIVSLPEIGKAQSALPQKLTDCTPETESFIDERRAIIKSEVDSLTNLPAAGYYQFSSEGGSHWVLMWAPQAGFIAFLIPDTPCFAQVSYGTVKYHKNQLTLIPEIEFGKKLQILIAKHLQVVHYRKERFLIPRGKLRAFKKVRNTKMPSLKRPYLSQGEFIKNEWYGTRYDK
jgi:hypothetical protein